MGLSADPVVRVRFFLGPAAGHTHQGISRFFRWVRALRPLRIINQFDGIKDIFEIIVLGWKELLLALAVMLLLFIPYAIWGLNIFNGKTWAPRGSFCEPAFLGP